MKQPQEVQCTECVFPSSSVVMTHKPESGGFGSIKTFFRSSSVSRIWGGGGRGQTLTIKRAESSVWVERLEG